MSLANAGGAYDPVAHGALCHLCPLAGQMRPVPPEPAARPLALLVGEGPGRIEESQGRPFVGRTGKFLESLLKDKRVGLPRGQLHLTNAALCRGDTDEENELAARCCSPRLLRELAAFPAPTPIITLGKSAAVSILNQRNITKIRGFIFVASELDPKTIRAAVKAGQKPGANRPAQIKGAALPLRALLVGRTVLPTLHPAFVLRSETWKPILQVDLRRIAGVVKGALRPPWDDAGRALLIRTAAEVAQLWKLGAEVSLDLETDGKHPLECAIRTIQISDGRRTYVIFPWRAGMSPGLQRFLRSRKRVVTQNGFIFDSVVLYAHGVT